MDSWLVVFRGCFGILFRRRGEIDTPVTSVRWSSIVPRKKIARKLGRLFCRILVWRFFGDVLNTEWTTEKYYSTLEFKVIGIVYIVGYSIVGTR